jgi:pantothenate kinase
MISDDLVERALRLHQEAAAERVIIGIAGVPGAGKTTLALALVARLSEALGPERVAHVPMDGYHLADRILSSLGLSDRKGASETFDVFGYVAMLRRLKTDRNEIVYAPIFERDIEQPLAGAIAVKPDVEVIVTEGNYLLLEQPGWREIRDYCREIWYCDEVASRKQTLIERHQAFGKSAAEAIAWVERLDEKNAVLIRPTAVFAQLTYKRDDG